MLTIFTIPKAFKDPHISIIQKNALLSWKEIGKDVEIFTIGDEEGVREISEKLDIINLPKVVKNEFNTPLLDSAFSLARNQAKNDILMYVNADIIFLDDLLPAIKMMPKKDFMATGRRMDLDIENEINPKDPTWQEKLKKQIKEKGKLHSPAGMDYFIFHKDSFKDLPSFAVGRVGWDNWLIRHSRKINKFTIDATEYITAIHQNHRSSEINSGTSRKGNPEALRNSSFAKHPGHAFTTEDSNWKLTPKGLQKNYFFQIPFLKRYIKYIIGK